MHLTGRKKITESTLAQRYRVLLDVGRTLTGTLAREDLFRTIYRESSRVLDTEGFYISLYDEARDLATVVFYADRGEERHSEITYRGSESEVIRTGEASVAHEESRMNSLLVLGEDGEEKLTRSAISAPLRYEGRVIGAISAQSYTPARYTDEDVELLQGVADLAAVAIENARYVAELRRRHREAERIEEIGRAVAASLRTTDVLREVIDATLELLSADGATVWLAEAERDGELRVELSEGSIALPGGARWTLEPGLEGRLRETPGYLLYDDLDGAPIPSPLRRHLKARSGLGAPLLVEDELVGALTAGCARRSAFSEDDARVLTRLAAQASVALENARLHADLEALSLTDPLTELPNRRHLSVYLERQVAAARRGRDLAAVIFDLDRFKELNDSLGHTEGDRILRRVARVLEREVRSMNLVARFGGDEFVAVLADTDAEGARSHALRVATAVARDETLRQHRITLSYGIAVFDPSMETGEDLIRAADRDLYRAKDAREGPGEEPPR